MKRFRGLAWAAALLTIAVFPAGAVERKYLAAGGDLTSLNCDGEELAGAPAVGGVCFDIPPGTPYAKVSIDDALAGPIAAEFYFDDAADESVEGTNGVLCTSRAVPVPATAATITVYLDTALALLDCGLTAAPGTTGTLTVDWVDGPDGPGVNLTEGRGSPNVTPVANIRYPVVAGWPWPGGTDLEFFTNEAGRRYAMTGSYQNGMRIIDVTAPTTPTVVSTYDCKIFQADIQIFTRDGRRYVAYSVDDYSNTNVESDCFRDVGYQLGEVRWGTFIMDITDVASPHAIGFMPFAKGSHNTTIHPGGRYLYSSNADVPGAGELEIFDLADLTHPRLSRVVALGPSLPSHDVTFNADGSRAYVAALTSTLILNTTDPQNPSIVGRILDPTINIHHQADPITMDDPLVGTRTFLIVTDEIAGAEGNGVCPGGAIHVYDITGNLEKTPIPVGVFEVPDTRPIQNRLRCTAHVLRMYPEQKLMTIAWYTAGVRVLDLSDLAGLSVGTEPTGSLGLGIKQIGWFAFDKTDTWAVKAPVDGFEPDGSFYLYGSDQLRGFDVYRFDASAARSQEQGRWLTAEQARARLVTSRPSVAAMQLTLFCLRRPAA